VSLRASEAEDRLDRAEIADTRAASGVALPELTPAKRGFRLPARPVRAFAIYFGVLMTVLALGFMVSRTDSPVIIAGAAAVVAVLGLVTMGAFPSSFRPVPIVVGKQDSMMDVLIRREFARARRRAANLSVASVSLVPRPDDQSPSRGALAEVVDEFSSSLRVTDVIAYGRGGRRLTLLLSDTSPEDARAVMRRLASQPRVGGRVQLGLASFPDEAVTYGGLRDIAAAREQPLTADGLSEARARRRGSR
jgi:hypothetical protein